MRFNLDKRSLMQLIDYQSYTLIEKCIVLYIFNYDNIQQISQQRDILMNKLGSKMRVQKIGGLLSMPYAQLIQELMVQGRRSKGNKHDIGSRHLLQISCRHQCGVLFEMYKKSKQSGNQQETQQTQIGRQWEQVSSEGLSQLLDTNASNVGPEQTANVLKYLSDVSSIIVSKSDGADSRAADIAQVMSTGLCEIFPLVPTTTKQNYISTLHKLMKAYNEVGGPSAIMPIHRLLPSEMFNICDQPIIRHLYYSYLFTHLHKHPPSHLTLSWLQRFGLPCLPYLISSQQISVSNVQASLMDSMHICNALYLIVRKILPYNSSSISLETRTHNNKNNPIPSIIPKTNHNISQILTRIYQIINLLPIISLLKNPQLNVAQFIQRIQKTMKDRMVENESKIESKQVQLLDIWGAKNGQQQDVSKKNCNKSMVMGNVVEVKIVRCLLLLLHVYISKDGDSEVIERIRQALQSRHIANMIKNIIYFGDTLAELLYANELYLSRYKDRLFTQQQLEHMGQVRAQYLCYIDKHLYTKSPTHAMQIPKHRYNNLEYLLCTESRLLYHPNTILRTDRTMSDDYRVGLSLSNDNEFMGSWAIPQLTNLIAHNIAHNVALKVEMVSKSQYPYLPALALTDIKGLQQRVYITNPMLSNRRINHTSPHHVVNASSHSDIQQTIYYYAGIPI